MDTHGQPRCWFRWCTSQARLSEVTESAVATAVATARHSRIQSAYVYTLAVPPSFLGWRQAFPSHYSPQAKSVNQAFGSALVWFSLVLRGDQLGRDPGAPPVSSVSPRLEVAGVYVSGAVSIFFKGVLAFLGIKAETLGSLSKYDVHTSMQYTHTHVWYVNK